MKNIKKRIFTKANIFIIIAAISGGSVPVAAKFALDTFDPFTLVFLRFFFACIALLPLVLKSNELSASTFKKLFPVALVGALNPILLFIALQFTAASFSPLIYGAVPALTAIYIYLFTDRKLSSQRILGILVGLAGVSSVVMIPILGDKLTGVTLQGNLLIFLAAIAFTAYGIMSKSKQEKLNISPLALTFYFGLVTLLISTPFSIYEITQKLPESITLESIASAVYVGVIGTGLFYLAYQFALKHGNAITASIFTYIQPIIAVALPVLLLGEDLSVILIIGGTLSIIGAQLSSKPNGSQS
jgi:drug/metabolite transporter (DMT)-like permease